MNMNIFNGRQYQPVSQKVESDSEDDEVTLYTSSKNNTDGHFGLGSYDQSRDLELPPVFKAKRKSATTMSRCQTACAVSVFTIVLAIVVTIAIMMIVYGQSISYNIHSINTFSHSIDTSCTPIPTPLFTLPSPTESPSAGSTTVIAEVSTTAAGRDKSTDDDQLSVQTTSESIPTLGDITSTTSTLPTDWTTEPSLESTEMPEEGANTTPSTTGLNNNLPKVISDAPKQTDVVSIIPTSDSSTTPPSSSTQPSPGDSGFYWEREFFPSTTESSIQISDMNRDGVPDVIAARAFSQCGVQVIAMDGNSGDTIWEAELKFEAFAIRCELDVNLDGVDDCLTSGRFGGFAALDGVNGTILWEVDKEIVYPRYNFYFPLIVKDLDGDKVEDIVNIHSGDQTYSADETNRSPGFLIAVSGATGRSLMDPILLPDGHESYMSPVFFRLNGKFDLIVFGTGGETIPGSLWAVSMYTLRQRIVRKINYRKSQKEDDYSPFKNDTFHSCYLDSDSLDAMRPEFDETVVDFTRPYIISQMEGYCPKWSNIVPIWNKYGVCLYRFLTSTSKGIMLPPVIVDLNQDGVKDLVVSTFDGHTVALNGSDLVTKLWDVHYPNTETYSIPAPVFYTDDSVPDILIRTSLGEWSTYNRSTMRLLDGSSGKELWNFTSAHTSMMSPLTITSYSPGLDAMLFITVGSLSSSSDDTTNTVSDSDSIVNSTFPSNSSNSTNESEHDAARVDRRHSHTSDLTSDGPDDGIPMEGGDDGDQGYDDTMFDEFKQLGEGEEFEDAPVNSHNQMDYENDFIQLAMKMQDPPNLWISTPEDPFPDPDTDPAGFIEYCGESFDRLTGYVWFVTKDMIESGVELRPLAKHDPYIVVRSNSSQSSGNSLFKRHGHDSSNTHPSLKGIRCAHITAPVMSFTTPALGDFNQDGLLDIAYSIVWGPLGGLVVVPPKFKVFVFTLEERFSEVYGSNVVVDFNGFLPPNQQPWSRFMGTMGDNVYQRN